VNEAQACLQEGVVADADLLDGAMIFATGFAPFRGGPMHYSKQPSINTSKQPIAKPATRKKSVSCKADASL
jgi:3-hydroxyacyl-CoA dehydrogenase/enoyl-CoA hydratase/3-hydroxybutyryl-CoA epimerase